MEFNTYALFAALCFLALGFLVLYLAKRISIEIGNSAWTVFFAPIFIYLVLSGSLTEFKAPGLEAKFRDALQKPPSLSLLVDVNLVGKNAETTNIAANTTFSIGQKVLAISLADLETATAHELDSYSMSAAVSIYQSFLSGKFIGVVVLDKERRPISILEADYFLELLRV